MEAFAGNTIVLYKSCSTHSLQSHSYVPHHIKLGIIVYTITWRMRELHFLRLPGNPPFSFSKASDSALRSGRRPQIPEVDSPSSSASYDWPIRQIPHSCISNVVSVFGGRCFGKDLLI
eukprot:sb/3476395/